MTTHQITLQVVVCPTLRALMVRSEWNSRAEIYLKRLAHASPTSQSEAITAQQ